LLNTEVNMPTHIITIRKVRGIIEVSPQWKTLHKHHYDKVKWKAVPGNLKFLICFGRRTPFSQWHYGTLSPDSGNIKVRPLPGQTIRFKYRVEVGRKSLDPGIIIQW
jgi:hypothetical protein